jgi:peptidoglycan/xylan/chitin deacetylase (PgdA/CDA1 family)
MQVRIIFLSIVALFALASAGTAETCAGNDGGLGASRIVEIDSAGGPLYGDFTHRAKEPSFLGPKEVVLTFDDGPLPAVTRSILDTLDRFCTKATFFSVGRMAFAYPSTVRPPASRSRPSSASRDWPIPIPCSPTCRRAVWLASPSTSSPTTAISATAGAWRRSRCRGVLFHDIKAATAKALPVILAALQARGYKVVHMRASAPLKPLEAYTSALVPLLGKSERQSGKPASDPASAAPWPKCRPRRGRSRPSPSVDYRTRKPAEVHRRVLAQLAEKRWRICVRVEGLDGTPALRARGPLAATSAALRPGLASSSLARTRGP